VSRQLVILDFFLICHGNNERQVRTIAAEIERRLGERGIKPVRREGEREGRWVVLDFVDFLVHVFHREDRDLYELERLWSDATVVPFDDTWEEHDERAAAEAAK